jgi:hypothetical protein
MEPPIRILGRQPVYCGMTAKKLPQKTVDRATAHDHRTELVRQMTAQENAATDAKTAKLRALRLAREAEEKVAEPAAAPATAKARAKRKA